MIGATLLHNTEKKLQKEGVKFTRVVPPKIALPLLEHATMEHEADLMPKEVHAARRTEAAPRPSSGGRIGLEKTRERGTALPRIDCLGWRRLWRSASPALVLRLYWPAIRARVLPPAPS
jgi:hypothetical protein